MPTTVVLGATIGTWLAGAAAVATVAGVAIQADASRKAAHLQQQANLQQQQANAQQQKIAENTNRQQRIANIRRARQASANVRQQAVNAGSSTSTSASAAASNPFVNAGASIGFQNEQIGFARARNDFLAQATASNNAAIGSQQNANTGGAISSIGMQVFQSQDGFKGLFSSKSSTPAPTTQG